MTVDTADCPRSSIKLSENDHQSINGDQETEPKMPTLKPLLHSTQSSPSFVFNGPVLIGYTAEQAAALLQVYSLPKAA